MLAVPDHVVVISDDSVESGGASAVAMTSIKLLTARGVKVTLLNGHAKVNDELHALGVQTVSFGGANLLEQGSATVALKGLYDRDVRAGIDLWISTHDTPKTVYHLHNWHKVLSPSVFGALKRVDARLIMSAHDYFLVCPNGAFFNFPIGNVCSLKPLSIACLGTNCDRRHYAHKLWRVARQVTRGRLMALPTTRARVIAPHEGMVEPLRRGGFRPDSISILRNPVTPWTSERITAENNNKILFVGRLEEDKGVDVIAQAASLAGLTLTIVGDGSLRAELAKKHPEHEIVGWKSRSELTAIARTVRLVVVPTRWRETFGLVTFEALMSGLPVLVSRYALVAEEVKSLGMAEICDPKDVEGTARILRDLVSDDTRVKRMSRLAFDQAQKLAPDVDTWCERLLEIYRDVLRNAESRGRATPNEWSDVGLVR